LTDPKSSDDIIGFIIPVYNEEDLLESAVEELETFLRDLQITFELILVENGSDDRTREILKSLAEAHEWIRPVTLEKADYGEALRAGIEATPHEFNFILNLDWWDENFIETALDCRDKYDLIIGSKRLPESTDNRSPYRHLLSWGLNTLLWILVGFQGTETHGLKAFKKSSVEKLLSKINLSRGMFDTELVLRAQHEGLNLTELPVILDEKRPPRNWMTQKIAQNLYDIIFLTYFIRRDYSWSGETGNESKKASSKDSSG
jgi:glycosyltransferase involved in cell wall biosynthesis